MGEPSMDWELTLKAAEVCRSEGKKVVIVTRLWGPPPPQAIHDRLTNLQVSVHLSLCALDSPEFIKKRLDWLKTYEHGVLRLVTFAFSPLHPRVVVQDNLHAWGGPVLEQPARLQPSNPTFRQVYRPLYAPCRNHVTGEDNPRWLSAGPLYATTACAESCPECPHQCYTRPSCLSSGTGHMKMTTECSLVPLKSA